MDQQNIPNTKIFLKPYRSSPLITKRPFRKSTSSSSLSHIFYLLNVGFSQKRLFFFRAS